MKKTVVLLLIAAMCMGAGWRDKSRPDPPTDPPATTGDASCPNPIPTVLIHGYLAQPSVMKPTADYLTANGWAESFISMPAIPNTSLSADFSAEVKKAVDELLAKNPGYDIVDCVGYSRGAKNCLDYIMSGGKVRNLVTMDGYMPNKPSPDQTPGDTLYYCIDSSLGRLATLDGAKVVNMPANHLMVWNTKAIIEAVADGLKCNGANN